MLASPAADADSIYLRTKSHLYRIRAPRTGARARGISAN
jgi:hypothetical protein